MATTARRRGASWFTALEQTVAFGVITNQAFLAGCLRHPAIRGGRGDDGVHRQARRRTACARSKTRSHDAALAALLLYVTDPHAPAWRSGRTLAATFPAPLRIELDQGIHDVEIMRERDGGYVAALESGERRFEIDELGPDTIRFRSNGLSSTRPGSSGSATGFTSCSAASPSRFAISRWPRRRRAASGG